MRVALFVLLMFFMVSGAVCVEHVILVDSSGSMAGFYNTGSVRMLVLNLQRTLGSASLYLFSDREPRAISGVDDLQCISRDTRIDLAFQGVPGRPDTLWLITDNVQDRSETPRVDASTEEFYEILRHDDVVKIYIMPCFLDFDGKLYLNRDDQQYTYEYTGRKGLLVYGILLNSAYIKQFEELAKQFERTVMGYESKLLLAKPLDKETLDIKPAGQVAGNEPPNVRLDEKGNFFGKGFKEGKKIRVIFYVKLLSKFEDLIVSGKINASVVDGCFKSVGFKDAPVGCTIYPEEVEIAPKETSTTVYKITINLNKVEIKKNPVSILRAALSGKPGRAEGIVRLEVQVPGKGFRFTNDILRSYNADDIRDYKRIFGMGSLINYMPAEVTRIPIEYNVVLAVDYPYWPAILVILLVAAIIGAVYLIYRSFSLMQGDRLGIACGGREEAVVSLSPVFGKYNISIEGDTYASICKSLSGAISAKAKRGFLIDGTARKRRLNRDMDSFTVADSDGTKGVSVQVRSLRKEGVSGGEKSDLDVGFH